MEENLKLKLLIFFLGTIVIYLKRWELLYIFLKFVYFFLFTSKKGIFISLITFSFLFLVFYAYKILKEKKNSRRFMTSIYQSKFEKVPDLNKSCPIDFLQNLNNSIKKSSNKKSKTPRRSSKKKRVKKNKNKTPKKNSIFPKRNLRSNDKNFVRKKNGSNNYTSLLL